VRKLFTLSALIVLLDQATKLAVKGFSLFGIHHDGMQRGQSIPVLGDFLHFTFVENPGMAFGLDFGMPLLLGLFSIGAAVLLVHLLRRSGNGKIGGFHFALAMILGGAVGNLIDRLFYGLFYGYAPLFKGKVVDFIDVDILDINFLGLTLDRFYIFNIADSAVSVGIVLLLIFYPKYQKQVEKEQEEKKRLEENDAKTESNLMTPHLYSETLIDEGSSLEQEEEAENVEDEPKQPSEANQDDDTRPSAKLESPPAESDSTRSDSDSTSSDAGSFDSFLFD